MEIRLMLSSILPQQYTNLQNTTDTGVLWPHLGRLDIGLSLESGSQLNNREKIL